MPRITPVLVVIGILCSGAISGCSRQNIPGVYRIDIQQGNVITQEMLDQLEPGMERRKVRYILGTPMLTDTFNQDRWDYYYSYSEGGSSPSRLRISVFFDEDKLAKVEGDVTPGASRRPVTPRKETIVTVPRSTGDEGFLSALKPDFLGGKKNPPSAAAEPDAATSTEPEVKSEDAKPASEDTAAAAEPVQVPVPGPGDEAYLQQLFEGFGKTNAVDAGGAGGGQIRTGGGASNEGEEVGGSATAETRETEESAETDGGFIRRLLDRLRRAPEPDSTPAAEPTEASPPAATEPAAP